MDRSILNGVRNVCPGQRCIRFVSVLSDVFPIVLLQPLRGQKTSRSSAAFLAFAAVSRTVLCCSSTVHSTCYPLFFAAKLRKDRIQRKEYIVVIIEAPEKWKPQILLGISGRSFPQTACGKFSEKWKAFSTREKWKVCGVENKSLWEKNRGKNLPHSKYRFHKLWKTHSTTFYHGFHKPASTAVKCRGHSGHFFCT